MAEVRRRTVVVLASGDPLVSGIGSTLVDLFGPDFVDVMPAVSSVALARARMRLVGRVDGGRQRGGRDAHVVLRHLAPGHRVLVLSSDETHAGGGGRAARRPRLRREPDDRPG